MPNRPIHHQTGGHYRLITQQLQEEILSSLVPSDSEDDDVPVPPFLRRPRPRQDPPPALSDAPAAERLGDDKGKARQVSPVAAGLAPQSSPVRPVDRAQIAFEFSTSRTHFYVNTGDNTTRISYTLRRDGETLINTNTITISVNLSAWKKAIAVRDGLLSRGEKFIGAKAKMSKMPTFTESFADYATDKYISSSEALGHQEIISWALRIAHEVRVHFDHDADYVRTVTELQSLQELHHDTLPLWLSAAAHTGLPMLTVAGKGPFPPINLSVDFEPDPTVEAIDELEVQFNLFFRIPNPEKVIQGFCAKDLRQLPIARALLKWLLGPIQAVRLLPGDERNTKIEAIKDRWNKLVSTVAKAGDVHNSNLHPVLVTARHGVPRLTLTGQNSISVSVLFPDPSKVINKEIKAEQVYVDFQTEEEAKHGLEEFQALYKALEGQYPYLHHAELCLKTMFDLAVLLRARVSNDLAIQRIIEGDPAFKFIRDHIVRRIRDHGCHAPGMLEGCCREGHGQRCGAAYFVEEETGFHSFAREMHCWQMGNANLCLHHFILTIANHLHIPAREKQIRDGLIEHGRPDLNLRRSEFAPIDERFIDATAAGSIQGLPTLFPIVYLPTLRDAVHSKAVSQDIMDGRFDSVPAGIIHHPDLGATGYPLLFEGLAEAEHPETQRVMRTIHIFRGAHPSPDRILSWVIADDAIGFHAEGNLAVTDKMVNAARVGHPPPALSQLILTGIWLHNIASPILTIEREMQLQRALDELVTSANVELEQPRPSLESIARSDGLDTWRAPQWLEHQKAGISALLHRTIVFDASGAVQEVFDAESKSSLLKPRSVHEFVPSSGDEILAWVGEAERVQSLCEDLRHLRMTEVAAFFASIKGPVSVRIVAEWLPLALDPQKIAHDLDRGESLDQLGVSTCFPCTPADVFGVEYSPAWIGVALRRIQRLEEGCDREAEGEDMEPLNEFDEAASVHTKSCSPPAAKRAKTSILQQARPFFRRNATSPVTLFLSSFYNYLCVGDRDPHTGLTMTTDPLIASQSARVFRNPLARSPFAHRVHRIPVSTGWSEPRPTHVSQFLPAAINFVAESQFMNHMRGSVSGEESISLLARMVEGGLAVTNAIPSLTLTEYEKKSFSQYYQIDRDSESSPFRIGRFPTWRRGKYTGINLNRLSHGQRVHFLRGLYDL